MQTFNYQKMLSHNVLTLLEKQNPYLSTDGNEHPKLERLASYASLKRENKALKEQRNGLWAFIGLLTIGIIALWMYNVSLQDALLFQQYDTSYEEVQEHE